MRIIKKLFEKGVTGVFNSIRTRLYNKFVAPWWHMHSSFARFLWRTFKLLPIKNKLIIFESEPDFCDNSWALYQYIKENRPKYRFVWIVKNVQEFKTKVDERTTFVTRYGGGLHIKTIYYYATARYNFYTHWTFQPYLPRKGQTVINLWHGGFPLKAKKTKNKDYYDWLISMGIEGMDALTRYVGCPHEKVLPLGEPRIDLLINNISKGIDNPFCIIKGAKKVILWMPTFRASWSNRLSEALCDTETGLPLMTTQESLVSFNEKLQDMNVIVIVKIHHLQATKNVFKQKYSNFIILTDDILSANGLQLYEIIGKSDALLTDYSTITWDYLAVNKPIGFILDDIKGYETSCGFNVKNIRSLLKGEHIYNEEQLLSFIQHIIDGEDEFKEERQKQLEQKILLLPQGGNCKNIVDYFGV